MHGSSMMESLNRVTSLYLNARDAKHIGQHTIESKMVKTRKPNRDDDENQFDELWRHKMLKSKNANRNDKAKEEEED